MLSAVAARKARLEGKQVVQVVPRTPAKPAIVADESPKLVSPPSKRKPSENASKPIKKKRKKAQQPAQDTPPRYFNEDAFKTQQDVIVVADDSDDSEEGFTGDAFVAEADMTVDNADATNTATPATKARRRRAWSPSAPLRDSSDEEDDELLDDESAPPPVVIPVAGPSKLVPKVLSTFQPVLDQNMFYLTPEDIQILDLPSPSLQCDNTGTLIVLHPSNSLALLGTYRLTVLQGAVSLMGSVLTASRTCHRVFAPRSSPIPVLRSIAASLNGPQSAMPDRVRSTLGPGATVVLLQELQTGVERLGTVCRTFEGVFSPSRSQSKMPTVELNLRGVYMLQAETSDTSPFIMPPSWDATISSMVDHNANPQEMNYPRSVYLVKGPRNTGKSTFGKVLLNALLTRYRRVAFLECDMGQSEFTPAGMVALNILDAPVFGPAFTHPCLPYASHFVGATSPKSSPSYYVECVQALIQAYNLDIQHGALLNDNDDKGTDNRLSDIIPLVVNTMGWSRGLGSDLSLKIEETVEPSQIFELEAPQGDDAYPTYPPFDSADAHASHGLGGLDRVRRLEAVAPCSASSFFTAADHRTLSVLSYFHATFAAPSSSPPASQDAPVSSPSSSSGSAASCIARAWDVSLPLCAQLPYEVDCKVAFDHIALVGAGMEDVVPSELAQVLNGAIVGLVQCEPGTMDDLASDSASPALALAYRQGNPPPSPFSSKCCGLALVRAISHSATGTLMHLLTPVPPEHLALVRVLVKGELELPVWGMLDFRNTQGDVAGVERDKVPFLRWGKSEAAGAERRRVRRNLMRRGQM
ncbi:uncharacterized protein B0H18DRAFT_1124020 [Fomitopsis serialis]|uniref:uncharacterized protein n=1 Tax=Fomitopsis serialis TaxID=139415 RepID=UPI002007EA11|nr:uncharacterized protein B0H18DRAFT_1124020 [Neoantrodia serialis]KAH9916798.1 hypothetical protein B0H18DRAFT_1124020 [Neoantrodia serialis]